MLARTMRHEIGVWEWGYFR